MIQELVDFGKRVAWGQERALETVLCSMIISIDEKGTFKDFIPFNKEIEAEVLVKYDKGSKCGYLSSKKGQSRFLLDKREEVLGIGDKESEKKHKRFMDKLRQYQHVGVLKPVFLFYDERNINGLKKAVDSFLKLKLKKEESKKITFTFMVGTTLLLNTENVRTAIIKRFYETENILIQKTRSKRNCSICGRSDTLVLDEPYGLVKMPKGQTAGCALVSFNEPAFESYGLKGNLNASICRNCARNLTEGLSYMLTEGHMVPQDEDKKRKEHYQYKHRLNISDNTLVLFWTRYKTDDEDGFDILDEPDEENVKKLLESAWCGDHRLGSVVENNMFDSCTLSSAAARFAVRDWTAISLDEYKRNIADWFRDIEIQNREGTTLYSPLRFLVNATQRDKMLGEKQKSDLNSKS